jgi:dTDP-4-amino-4,6-dideoxygalactose transaminase
MNSVTNFENTIARFYGAPYAVATDCCTHAIELCLRLTQPKAVTCPKQTYLSIPMTFEKLELQWEFYDYQWQDYYYIGNTNVVDAAVLWKENSYIDNTFMCLSFQFKKHLNLGRGGMILTDNQEAATKLKKMSYDGRLPDVLWKDQDIDILGYHYYMTPETAELGIEKFHQVKNLESKRWSNQDYPDISKMKVFNVK